MSLLVRWGQCHNNSQNENTCHIRLSRLAKASHGPQYGAAISNFSSQTRGICQYSFPKDASLCWTKFIQAKLCGWLPCYIHWKWHTKNRSPSYVFKDWRLDSRYIWLSFSKFATINLEYSIKTTNFWNHQIMAWKICRAFEITHMHGVFKRRILFVP